GALRYVVLYGGIVFEMIMPILGRKRLATMAVHSHHLTERYGLMTIILLGESVISLVSSFEDIHWAPQTVFAGVCGFLLAASLWWIYFENMEHHIAGRNLRHGQMITYPHFIIYAGLGGIAAMIRFALLPEITLLDYKIMASFGILLFILTEQYFCFLFHPKKLRSALIFKAWLFNILFLLLIAFAPSIMTVLVGTTVLLVAYAELTRVKEL
ncbi:MAG: low temperature requirement protein A, partial [Alphaproteobacteria bacterium]|nr:low temperature requirement protein A [Alphaproteobacteria bacterium]